MSITSAHGYEMRIIRSGDTIADLPEPYWQTVQRLLADRGATHVARLLAYALRDLDKAQGKRELFFGMNDINLLRKVQPY
jgi:hypothetical protein